MKIAMIFPGYGSQFVGMAKELYDESRLIQEYFEEASNCLNINFVKLCFASSENELSKIDNAYESIFLVSSSIAALLSKEGIVPDIVTGYGLGEYSAICTAGGLSLPDGLYFLSKYAQFYQELISTLDVRIIQIDNLSTSKIDKLCKAISTEQDPVSIGVCLSKDSCIVTGILNQVNQIEEQAREMNAKIFDMPLEVGLHSSLMNPVVDQLAVYLEKVDFNDLAIPLIANLDGKKVSKGQMVKEKIMKKINSPVRWDKVVKELGNWDSIIEIGPGSKLSIELANRYPEKHIMAINKPVDIDILKNIIAQNYTELNES